MSPRKVLIAFFALLVAGAAGYWARATDEPGDGTGGGSTRDQWDPTGSHPLPNEGVDEAP